MKMRKKTLGLILLIFPWVLLPLVLAAYVAIMFLLSAADRGSNFAGIGNIINIALGFLGVIAVLGFLIGTPVGIFFLSRKEHGHFVFLKSKPRFQSLTDYELHAVSRWSWSAFFNPTIWAFGNRLWLWGIGTLIPFWHVYVWLRLAIDGRQIVWERSQLTIAQFQRRQKIIAWVIGIITGLAIVLSVPATGFFVTSSTKEVLTDSSSRSQEIKKVEFGDVSKENVQGPVTEIEDKSTFTSSGGLFSCNGFQDTDGDGLTDKNEEKLLTDPDSDDTDADGFKDFDELLAGFSPRDAKEYKDSDGDGLADAWEIYFYHSKETKVDSDEDGKSDFEEVKTGRDPTGDGDLTGINSDIIMFLVLVEDAQKQCNYK